LDFAQSAVSLTKELAKEKHECHAHKLWWASFCKQVALIKPAGKPQDGAKSTQHIERELRSFFSTSQVAPLFLPFVERRQPVCGSVDHTTKKKGNW